MSPPTLDLLINLFFLDPQISHSPLSIGLLFLVRVSIKFNVGVFFLHFTQYISIYRLNFNSI